MFIQVIFYVGLAVFITFSLKRFIRIARMPVHLRWELYPVPHEPKYKVKYGGSYMEESEWWTKPLHTRPLGGLAFMIPEVLLLKGVWEHNRPLWLWSWLFHWGLYTLIIAMFWAGCSAIVTSLGVEVTTKAVGLWKIAFIKITAISWISVVCGLIGTLGMIFMRLGSPKLRPFTSVAAIFNLLFILAIFLTGLISLAVNEGTVSRMIEFAGSLLRLNPAPELPAALSLHLIVLALFLIYFPFTHMTHMFAKYFTWDSVRWDDRPNKKGGKTERQVAEYLGYKVSWSAPHIDGQGKKNWVDVVTSKGRKDAKTH
ncbi:MAG: respiratory nitrate reductase subunit gamma [Calditrichota bacterium]